MINTAYPDFAPRSWRKCSLLVCLRYFRRELPKKHLHELLQRLQGFLSKLSMADHSTALQLKAEWGHESIDSGGSNLQSSFFNGMESFLFQPQREALCIFLSNITSKETFSYINCCGIESHRLQGCFSF